MSYLMCKRADDPERRIHVEPATKRLTKGRLAVIWNGDDVPPDRFRLPCSRLALVAGRRARGGCHSMVKRT
jgi:hypothetical protein